MHFGEIYDDRKDSTAPHIIFRPQLGGHRWCGLAICTFHLGFGLVAFATKVWDEPAGWIEPTSVIVGGSAPETGYTIDDFPHLATGRLGRTLFDGLRAEVLGLDPCVEEEFNKLYVSFKAETNFADVVPLTSGLNLILNLEIHELVDPRGLAEDVSTVGHWGNGNVRLQFTDPAQLTPVMALVRQALEAQLEESVGVHRRIDKVPLLGVGD